MYRTSMKTTIYNKMAAPAKLFRISVLIAFILVGIVIVLLLVYYNITFIRIYSSSITDPVSSES